MGETVTILGQCGDYYYTKLTDGNEVFIKKSLLQIPVTGISLNSEEIQIAVGQTYQMTAKIIPGLATDKTVLWSSTNGGVAKVDANGKVTGIKQGTTFVEAKDSSGKVVEKCRVNVQANAARESKAVVPFEIVSYKTDYDRISIKYKINLK